MVTFHDDKFLELINSIFLNNAVNNQTAIFHYYNLKIPIAERGGNSGKTSFEITSTYNCSQYPSSEEY